MTHVETTEQAVFRNKKCTITFINIL